MRIRFEEFTTIISDIGKNVQKIKMAEIERFGLKSVHVLWLYQLAQYPGGLNASELARVSGTDRSLVSREIALLFEKEYVTDADCKESRHYNRRICLTESGKAVVEEIRRIAGSVQEKLDDGISEEEFRVFYRVLGLLRERLEEAVRTAETAGTGRK